MSPKTLMRCGCFEVLLIGCPAPIFSQGAGNAKRMDARVKKFQNENRSNWNDWNVPYEDGKVALNFQYRLTGREGLSEKMGLMERPSFFLWDGGRGRPSAKARVGPPLFLITPLQPESAQLLCRCPGWRP
jgi:hypothetical protein